MKGLGTPNEEAWVTPTPDVVTGRVSRKCVVGEKFVKVRGGGRDKTLGVP